MRKYIEAMFRFAVSNGWTWRVLEMSLLKISRHFQFHRDQHLRERDAIANQAREKDFVFRVSPELTVLNGPFKGMRYPSVAASGSAVIPKFLGSYEQEISDQLESLLCSQRYDVVVDVGAAEGYYAIGVARLLPHAKVYAYDTNPVAQEMCRSLAEFNNVSDRIRVSGLCEPAELCELLKCDRALIIVDCEGGESMLLTAEVAERCRKHDLLVELHDDVAPGVSQRIGSLFANSHEVISIPAIYDAIKARTYRYPELEKFTTDERRWAFSENRSTGIEWFFLISKAART